MKAVVISKPSIVFPAKSLVNYLLIGLGCLLLLLFPQALKGQSFNGGFLGGISASQISGDNLSGFNKAGIYAGLFVNRYINPRFGFQMELDFIQKGSRKNPDPEKDDFESYILRLNYIEIPLLFKYEQSRTFSFEAGLAFGVLLSSFEEANEGMATVPSKEFEDMEFSILGGFYYQFVKGSKFSLRYSNSLMPVRDHASGQTYRLNKGQYNSVLMFSYHRQINFPQR